MNFLKLNIKTHMLIFMGIVLVVGLALNFSTMALVQVIITPIIAIAVEFLILKIKKNNISLHMADEPAITGMILALLISPNLMFAVIAPIIAIILKHVIVYKKINVFNPAALSAFIISLIGAGIGWWAATYLVIPLGLFLAWRLEKLRLSFSFLILYVVLNMAAFPLSANVRSFIEPITWFFAFFMLLEPKTSPYTKKGQYIFGAGAAILSAIFIIAAAPVDIFILSLLIMNLTKNWLNKKFSDMPSATAKLKSGYPDLTPLGQP
ncbi:MAG: RnfABCDGE type electron transport complex subunit D [Candidatus Aenigmarchaeota archaeon]|nr:RnfABCDGE type electron transport complex subunit D [Candidatus Aenigmarchaeota archaeon]